MSKNDFLVNKEVVDSGNKVADHMILKIYETMEQIHDEFADAPLLRAFEEAIYSSDYGKQIIEQNNGERIPITLFDMYNNSEYDEDTNTRVDKLRIQFNNPLFRCALDIDAAGDIMWTMEGDEMSICPQKVISQQVFGVAMFEEFKQEEDARLINYWIEDMCEVIYVQYRRMMEFNNANGFVDWNIPEMEHLIELENQMFLSDLAEEKKQSQNHDED